MKTPPTLLDRLCSREPDERELALQQLRGLSADHFARQIQQYKQRSNRLALLAAANVAYFLFFFWMLPALLKFPAAYPGLLVIGGLLLSGAYFVYCAIQVRQIGKALEQLRKERITQGGDRQYEQLTEVLDALYRSITTDSNSSLPPDQHYSVLMKNHQEMLLQELTKLTQEQAVLLTDQQRSVLRRWFWTQSGFDYIYIELGLAAINALVLADDPHIASILRELAKEPPATPNMQRVRETARAHLKTLEERAAELRQETTLLRASALPTQPDILLRPAQNTSKETPSDQLLRPTQSE